METSGNVLAAVRRIVNDKLMVEIDSPEADLVEMHALDSVSLVGLLVELEEHFDVSFDFESLELTNIRTIRSITELVEQARGGRPDGEGTSGAQ
jgi:acyl carrier protein